MPIPILDKKLARFTGTGDGICIIGRHGLGDVLYALPTLRALIQSGVKVSVYTRPFFFPLWQAIGVQPFEVKSGDAHIWKQENKHRFQYIYELQDWSSWDRRDNGTDTTSKIAYFAWLLDAELPKEFSLPELIHPERSMDEPFVLFAPESSSEFRSLPRRKARELFLEIGGNVLWLTASKPYTYYDALYNRHQCEDISELISLVWSAERIVAVESGVASLAAALGKPLTVICGPNGAATFAGAFRQYMDFEFNEVFGEAQGCSMPCQYDRRNGYEECEILEISRCLAHLDVEQVLTTITIEQE